MVDIPGSAPATPAAPDQPKPFDADAAVASYLANPQPDAGPALKSSVYGALDTKPDYEADLRKASAATGVPLAAARGDADYVKRQAQVLGLGLDGLVQTSPATTRFLSDPDNAKIAHDDTDVMAGLEKTLTGPSPDTNWLGHSLASGLHTLAGTALLLGQKGVDLTGGGTSFANDLQVLGDPNDPNATPAQHARALQMAHDLAAGKPQGAEEKMLYGLNTMGRASLDQFTAAGVSGAAANTALPADAQGRTYATLDPSKSAFLSPARLGSDLLQNAPTFLALAVTAKLAGAQGVKAETEALAAGASAEEASAARVLATSTAMAKIGAVSEGAIGYAQQAGQTQQQMADLTPDVLAKSSGYKTLIDAGFEPDVAKVILADSVANQAGMGAGLADFTTNLIGGGVLGHIIGEEGPWLARILKGGATEGIQEAVQSPLEQLSQNMAMQRADPNQKLGEGVLEQAMQGLALGGLMGGSTAGIAGAGGRSHSKADAAQAAFLNAASLQNLATLSEASKLRGRDVSSFQGFVADAAKDGPLEHVWLSNDGLSQSGVDPSALAAASPAVAEQINEARATGGDIQIPIEQFATLAPELQQGLIPHLKTDPTGMSQTEATEFMQNFGPELKANVEQVIADQAKKTELQASADTVRDKVLDQLTTANRFTHDVNTAYADLTSAFYSTQAQRLGVTPAELFESHPVSIGAQGVTDGSLSAHVEQGASEPNPIFYSGLEKAAAGVQTAKASPEQWAATLQKAPGVKKEELEWTGVLDWLKSQDGPVTKDQVMEHLQGNGVQVDEVVKGGAEGIEQQLDREEQDHIEKGTFQGSEHFAEAVGGEDEPAGWRVYGPYAEASDIYDDHESAQAAADELNGDEESGDLGQWRHERRQELQNDGGGTEFSSYKIDGANDSYRELLLTLPKVRGPGTHWNEQNVVAHVRFTERQGVDGKPVLFLEEVQSDWHQKGRTQGYKVEGTPEEIAAADKIFTDRIAERTKKFNELMADIKPTLDKVLDERIAEYHRLEAERDAARQAVTDEATRQSVVARSGDNSAFKAGLATTRELNAAADRAERVFGRAHDNLGFLRDRIARAEGKGLDGRTYPVSEQISGLHALTSTDNYLGEHAAKFKTASEELSAASLRVHEASLDLENKRGEKGIPDAPFRASYPQLVMKRMIRWAVDHGYEHVAWINGGQQNGGSENEEGNWFYGRNLPNATNDLIKKYGSKVEPVKVSLPGFERTEGSPEETAAIDAATAKLNDPRLADAIAEARTNNSVALRALQAANAGSDASAKGDAADAYRAAANRYQTLLVAHEQLQQKVRDLIRAAQASEQLGFKITPEMAAAASKGFALFQNNGQPRGSYNPDTNLITLLRGADLSTFMHESGHFYLETLARIASDPNSPEGMRDDMAKALTFMGHSDMTPAEWLSQSLDDRREGHEKFARAFEQYLMEGKAPSQELRGLFQRFRSWLTTIYQQLTALRVTLTPDVRGVFDRLVASEDQIAENEKAHSYGTMPDLQGHMTADQWQEYQRLGAQATSDAVDNLQTKSLRDMQWLSGARDRTIRQLQRDANTKRKAIRSEVETEVNAEPINQARAFLKHGVLEGQEQEGPTKLSLPDLREMYGEAPTALEETTGQKLLKVDYRKLGYGKYGMLSEEGLHPDHVAELFGFSSGDELVKTLLSAEPASDKIHGLTDQRMLERYGDLSDGPSIEKAADEALHNDARLRFVATEANALAKAVGKRRVLASAAKSFAAEMIGRQTVRDIKPSRYSAAEARAAVSADKAAKAGNLVEAATEKRNQLINGYAAKAAYDALDEVAKAVRYFARFDNAGTRKGLSPEYRDQIDALLERFEFKPATTLKEIARRKSLASWITSQEEKGFEPVIPDELRNEAFSKSYKDMSLDELRGLRDSVENIAHLARLKNKLLAAQDARDFAGTIEDATAEVQASAIGKPHNKVETNQLADKIAGGIRGYAVAHRKFDSLIHRLAGLEDNTTLWNVLVRPKNTASDKEAAMQETSLRAVHDLFTRTGVVADRTRQKTFIPEIGTSLSLEGRIAVALNWGNQGNRARIMDGDNWSPAQVAAILKTLEPRHFEFVQGMWDHINSYKPEIAAKERRINGVEPEFVEPTPFIAEASDGSHVEMRGGYYPIDYDPDRSAKADEHNLADTVKRAFTGTTTRATTARGHLKARVDEVMNRPVKKTFSVAFAHLSDVIHDLSWHEYLIDANRLLGNETLANSIRVNAGPEILRSLKSAIRAMAAGDVPAQNAFEGSVNYLRSGATVAGLGWNFLTALQQPLGLMNGAARIGPKWMGAGLKRWVGDALAMENTVKWVHAQSEFMRLRGEGSTLSRELYDVRGKLTVAASADLLKATVGGKAAVNIGSGLSAVEGSFYYFIGKMQMVADMPTWLGQYEKSMSLDADEKRAIAMADQAVRDSQGAGQIGDLAELQRGGPLMKIWTNFMSYFITIHNQLAESVERVQMKGVRALPLLASDVLLIGILPSVLGNSLRKLATGDDDWATWPADLSKGLMSDFFGMFVGLRDIAAAVTDGKDAPAGMRILQNTVQLTSQVKQGQMDDAFWKALNSEAGILLHYPAAQVQKTVLGMQALASGQTQNPLAVVSGPPPKPH